MTFVADQNPAEVEWGTTPPPPLLEALETLYALWEGYRNEPRPEPPNRLPEWWNTSTLCYQTAYNVMLRAFHEEYAP